MKQRDELLASMTDEVGELVLRDNVLQNLALSMTEAASGSMLLDAQMRLMRKLEAQGRLDRELEYLPSDAELAERRKAGRGLTRPEVGRAAGLRQDDALRGPAAHRAARPGLLRRGRRQVFPAPAASAATPSQIEQHRLKREIVSTWIANSVVNRGLDVFVSELRTRPAARLRTCCWPTS